MIYYDNYNPNGKPMGSYSAMPARLKRQAGASAQVRRSEVKKRNKIRAIRTRTA